VWSTLASRIALFVVTAPRLSWRHSPRRQHSAAVVARSANGGSELGRHRRGRLAAVQVHCVGIKSGRWNWRWCWHRQRCGAVLSALFPVLSSLCIPHFALSPLQCDIVASSHGVWSCLPSRSRSIALARSHGVWGVRELLQQRPVSVAHRRRSAAALAAPGAALARACRRLPHR
jgi:hypothetical protein